MLYLKFHAGWDTLNKSSSKLMGLREIVASGFERIPRWGRIVGICAIAVVVVLVLVLNLKPQAIGGMISAASDKETLAENETQVPSVIKEQYESAEQIATEAGLLLVITDKVYSDEIKADTVLSQDPLPGRIIQKGSVLSVVISTNVKDIVLGIMPDVVFHTQDAAETMLKGAGIVYKISYESSDSVQEGNVISQSVKAGEEVSANTTVSIVISKGSEKQKTAVDKSAQTQTDTSPEVVNKDKSGDSNESAVNTDKDQASDTNTEGDIVKDTDKDSGISAGDTPKPEPPKPEPPKYKVTFLDWDGSVINTQDVQKGSDATVPQNPLRTGYSFTGWSGTYTNVASAVTITAQYQINIYTVTFVDSNGNTIGVQQVQYGEAANPPTLEGLDFVGCEPDCSNVQADMTVTAKYLPKPIEGD